MGAGKTAAVVIVSLLVIAVVSLWLLSTDVLDPDKGDAGTGGDGGGGGGNEVVNQPPIAKCTASAVEAVVGDNITFNVGDSEDPDGMIIKYRIEFGDGTFEEFTPEERAEDELDLIAWHTYLMHGDFTVSLVVTDNLNVRSDPYTVGLHIRPADVSMSNQFWLGEAGGFNDDENVNFTLENGALSCNVSVTFQGLAFRESSTASLWLTNPYGDTMLNDTVTLSTRETKTFSIEFTETQLAITGVHELTMLCSQGWIMYEYLIEINY